MGRQPLVLLVFAERAHQREEGQVQNGTHSSCQAELGVVAKASLLSSPVMSLARLLVRLFSWVRMKLPGSSLGK